MCVCVNPEQESKHSSEATQYPLDSTNFHLVSPHSQNSTHRDFGDTYNLIEIVSIPLRDVPGIMIHRIQNPSVPLEYLSGWEPVGME